MKIGVKRSEALQISNFFLFVLFSNFSLTVKNLKIPFTSASGLSRIMCTLNGSITCVSTNMDKCLSIRRETVLWCRLQRLEISLIQSQPPSASFKHLTILITFSAASFRTFNTSKNLYRQAAHIDIIVVCMIKRFLLHSGTLPSKL